MIWWGRLRKAGDTGCVPEAAIAGRWNQWSVHATRYHAVTRRDHSPRNTTPPLIHAAPSESLVSIQKEKTFHSISGKHIMFLAKLLEAIAVDNGNL